MEENTTNICLTAKIDLAEMEKATRKAERLKTLLEEASSLINELASKEIMLKLDVEG